jgi:hypothetical protein
MNERTKGVRRRIMPYGPSILACFTFLFFHLDFGSSGVTVGTGWVGLCPNLSKQKKTKKMKIRV